MSGFREEVIWMKKLTHGQRTVTKAHSKHFVLRWAKKNMCYFVAKILQLIQLYQGIHLQFNKSTWAIIVLCYLLLGESPLVQPQPVAARRHGLSPFDDVGQTWHYLCLKWNKRGLTLLTLNLNSASYIRCVAWRKNVLVYIILFF